MRVGTIKSIRAIIESSAKVEAVKTDLNWQVIVSRVIVSRVIVSRVIVSRGRRTSAGRSV